MRGDPEGSLLWTTLSAAHLVVGTGEGGPHGERADGEPTAARSGLQPAVEPQDGGGSAAPGPRPAVRARQPEGGEVPAARRSGGVSGHEEEGAGGQLRQRRNGGREWRPKGEPEEVLAHDFKDGSIPYGVYDLAANSGWVSVGVGPRHGDVRGGDAGGVAWGARRIPTVRRLLVTADAGGSNGHRNRLWKLDGCGIK